MRTRTSVQMVAVLAAAAVTLIGPATAATAAPPAASPSSGPVVATQSTGAPGAVVSSEPLPAELWLAGSGDAYRMTYLTTGPRGVTPSTGMVFVPKGPAPAGGWPVIAWAHGTVGDSDFDAPSRTGVDPETRDFVASWLGRGYAIAATDYIGLGTPGVPPYLDGTAAAHAVIDSVRAARAIEPDLSRRWAVVGLSEGGQAAVLTGHLATAYAPELDFRGTVANGVPSNIETLVPLAGPWFPPGGLFKGLTNFMTFVFAGVRDVHPELDVDSYLTPIGRKLVDAAPVLPYSEFKKLSANVSVAQMLSKSLNNPQVLAVLRSYLQVPVSGYDRPLFIAQGLTDQVVPIPLTLKLIADMNATGTHPTFRIYPGDHIGSMFQAENDEAAFVAGLFGGGAPGPSGSLGSAGTGSTGTR
ncbi:lipase family protein [Speluncibacter jeojiensis]|uniref:Lipase family protein n=1 Tax=Speluncibacter jeojiensis TaxID=2710754 RepID=A0A9X4LXN7_9ACTN|nr:lipase family protein [Corynebacteriales bacterium D3-21]